MTFDRSYKNTTKKYRQTPHGAKSHRKSEWKTKHKIKFHNFDETYDKYINTTECELCNVELVSGNKGQNKKILDHDHLSGYARFICCNTCNQRIGKVDKNKLNVLLEIHRFHLI
tara:strand:+ start:277 stop:618 length:342 start_codon:yes stop_codon:yes gene_type:complete